MRGVLDLFDGNADGVVSWEEWMEGWRVGGKRLPDFGVSAGGGFRFWGKRKEKKGGRRGRRRKKG